MDISGHISCHLPERNTLTDNSDEGMWEIAYEQ
jgi:hypothetical protein